jgi:O-antigen ligase
MTYFLAALFFTLPFERIPTLEVYGFTLKASYVIAVILVLTFIIKKYKSITYSTSDYMLILFWLWGAITLLWSVNTQLGAIVILLWLMMFVLYFVVARALDSEKLRERAESIVLVSTALVCLFGIYQFIGDSLGLSSSFTGIRYWYSKQIEILGFPRIQSVALEPLYFSNFLLVPLYLVIKRYFNYCHSELGSKSIKNADIVGKLKLGLQTVGFGNKYFWLLILILINIVLGVSRGAYLAVIVTLAIMLLYLVINWRAFNSLKYELAGMIGAVIIAAGLSYLGIYVLNGKNAVSNFQNHAVVGDTESGTSVPGRVEMYKRAWGYFKEKPVGGIGIGSFGTLNLFYDENQVKHYGVVNNIYLEILAETGGIGLVLFSLFLLFYLRELNEKYRKFDDEKKLSTLLLFLGILAIFIQYNFFSTLYIIYIWVFLALLRSGIINKK